VISAASQFPQLRDRDAILRTPPCTVPIPQRVLRMDRTAGPGWIHPSIVKVLLDVFHEFLSLVLHVELLHVSRDVLYQLNVCMTDGGSDVALQQRQYLGQVRLHARKLGVRLTPKFSWKRVK